MKFHLALLSVPLLSLGCANYSACQDLRETHERIEEIETALADLETEPPSDGRDLRRAGLEKRRRMYLASNDRAQSDCRPMGKDRMEQLFDPDPGSQGRKR